MDKSHESRFLGCDGARLAAVAEIEDKLLQRAEGATLPEPELRLPDLDSMEGIMYVIANNAGFADGRRVVAIKTAIEGWVEWGFSVLLPARTRTGSRGTGTAFTGKQILLCNNGTLEEGLQTRPDGLQIVSVSVRRLGNWHMNNCVVNLRLLRWRCFFAWTVDLPLRLRSRVQGMARSAYMSLCPQIVL